MNLCEKVGAHKIVAIHVSNEGICAGMVGAQALVLLHGKIGPGKVDVTVKSTDPSMGSALAMYLQTMVC